MEKILDYLGVRGYHVIDFTKEIKCYIYNFENDKLIIAFSTNRIDDIKVINNLIPKYKHNLEELITNPNNLKDVDNKKIPLSQFLWDLYLVCFYKNGPENGENIQQKISDYERDRYVARKIIIQYETIKNIKDQYERIVFPSKYLDELNIGTKEEAVIEEQLLEKVKEINLFLNTDYTGMNNNVPSRSKY
ncbi:ABC-three component system middle component 1 [Niallia taxi]|uniref:ABC-three component system middle component 1 n=1 Tax=Niallia taxi TaxID=2499688 RepID=UPI00254CB47E|nr:ABC-three component system middle component 1 [Niallia taxi]MDK8641691.1 hypothetical protein [Niallia taxi]